MNKSETKYHRQTYILLGGLGTIFRGLEVVLLHVDVADDVVVHDCVLARAEEPRLLLRVVLPVLQTLQFVVEVDDVVGLFVAERAVLRNKEGWSDRSARFRILTLF